jgi:signal transduction histidine kinase
MKKSRFVFLLVVISSIPAAAFSQFKNIQEAKAKIYTAKNEAQRLTALTAIGKFRNVLPADTIYHFAQWAKKIALQLNDQQSLAMAEYSLLTGDLVKGKTDSVIYKIDNNATFKKIKATDTDLYYKIQLLKANALNRINKRPEALDLQLKLLNEAEKEGNLLSQLYALNYIGATYLNVNKLAEARQSWLQGLQLIPPTNNAAYKEIEAYILSNLALYYFNKYGIARTKEFRDSFLLTVNKTIALSREKENMGVLASVLSLRGNFYGTENQLANAEADIKEGLSIRQQIGDPLYVMNDFISLANLYLHKKEYPKCITAAKEGIAIAAANGIRGEKNQLITLMATAYKYAGEYKEYSGVLEQYIAALDSNQQLNAAEKIADIQTKYEVQKKETLIAQQKLSLFQRKLLIYGGGIATALLLFMLAYRFKKYQQQQKKQVAALLLEEKKQNDIAVKDAEEKERKRIAAELHDNLGVQANAILHNSTLLLPDNMTNKEVVADLQETAKEMLLNLRETLWDMKTSDVSATELWLRMINFMKQMGRHYTDIAFKVEGKAPDSFTISSSQALHVVLVLQETVNNSVKHANATQITATSLHSNTEWNIEISDNGKGFDMALTAFQKDNYGLSNMQQRAKEGNFHYTLQTDIGKGTLTRIGLNKC